MYAIWFIFHENDELILQDIINKLSKKYNSISFKPHITAYGLIDIKLDEISKICQVIASETKPFEVCFLDISYSKYFWKTLFVNLRSDKIMIEIFENFCKNIKKLENHVFEPHISLIYKKIPNYKKQEIIKNLELKKQFRVKGISILHYSEKIENWNIIKKFDFKNK
jgi:2'-5' RNA ligase